MADASPDLPMDPLGPDASQNAHASSLSRDAAKNPWSSPVPGKKARMTPGRGAAGPIRARSPKQEDRLRTPRRVPGRLTFEDLASGGSTDSSSLSQGPSPAATVAYAPSGVPLGANDQGTRTRPALPTIPDVVDRVEFDSALAEVKRLRGPASTRDQGTSLEASVRTRAGPDLGC